MLDISSAPDPVPKAKIHLLSPQLATMYAGKTGKTVTRDLGGTASTDEMAAALAAAVRGLRTSGVRR